MTKTEEINTPKFKIDTRPSKEVIVDSLIRDISVDACLYDLIDNSIDAARDKKTNSQQEALKPLKDFTVEIKISGEEIVISDNCGGISSEHLANSTLRFGQRSHHANGIGVFGVGLNRAIFKLGQSITIDSDTGSERSIIQLDTTTYLSNNEEWYLPAQKLPSAGKTGTAITIKNIHPETSITISNSEWIEKFKEEISLRYGRIIEAGLTIKIGGAPIAGKTVRIRTKSPFRKIQQKFIVSEENNFTVSIEVGQHEDHRFTAEPDYDKKKNRALTNDYGWTIYCNERAVIISDKTSKTGWAGKFHGQFYGFVGNIYFNCKDPEKLPWSTTKTSIDLNNSAYQKTLGQMKSLTKEWRAFSEFVKDFVKNEKKPLLPAPELPENPIIPQPLPEASSENSPSPAENKKQGTQKTKTEKPTPKRIDHNQLESILPHDIKELHCSEKLLALVHEAQSINILSLSYSGLVLIRMLFEVSAIRFLQRKGEYTNAKSHAVESRNKSNKKNGRPELAEKDISDLTPTLDEIISFLESHNSAWDEATKKHAKQALRKFGNHKETLNSAAHNPFQIINHTKALQIRDEVLPILRHFIES